MVEMIKQSHRNLGANFISRGSEERVLLQGQSGYAQSGPPAASGPDGAHVKPEQGTPIKVNLSVA